MIYPFCTGENGVTTESHPKKCFNFDAVLQPEVTQKEVFDEGMKPIVEHVLKGQTWVGSFPLPPHLKFSFEKVTVLL